METSLPSRSYPVRWTSLGRTISNDSPGSTGSPRRTPTRPGSRVISGLTIVCGPLVLHVVDEQALLHADLGGGQPEPGASYMVVDHVVGQAARARRRCR